MSDTWSGEVWDLSLQHICQGGPDLLSLCRLTYCQEQDSFVLTLRCQTSPFPLRATTKSRPLAIFTTLSDSSSCLALRPFSHVSHSDCPGTSSGLVGIPSNTSTTSSPTVPYLTALLVSPSGLTPNGPCNSSAGVRLLLYVSVNGYQTTISPFEVRQAEWSQPALNCVICRGFVLDPVFVGEVKAEDVW